MYDYFKYFLVENKRRKLISELVLAKQETITSNK